MVRLKVKYTSNYIDKDILLYNNRTIETMKKNKENSNFIGPGDSFLCPNCDKLLNAVTLLNYKKKSINKTSECENYVIIICNYCIKPFILKKDNGEVFKVPDNILFVKTSLGSYKFVKNTSLNIKKYVLAPVKSSTK